MSDFMHLLRAVSMSLPAPSWPKCFGEGVIHILTLAVCMLHTVLSGERDITSTQVFFGCTVSAHNSMPWLERGGRPYPGRPDALILDAPLWHHWPQVLIWVPFQASIFYVLAAWTQSEALVQSHLEGDSHPAGSEGTPLWK